MKLITVYLKRILLAFSIIYTLDLILEGANIFIPLNIYTVTIGTVLGPSGIIAMIIVSLII